MSRIDGYSAYQQTFLNKQTAANEIAGAKDGKRDPRIPHNNADDEAAVYEQSKTQKPVTYDRPTVGVKKSTGVDPLANLSDAAKSLLEELKEKYGKDTDFIIADFETDEEANELMAQGTKEYTVLIDPELLEKMAADESVKESTLAEIDNAKGQVNSMLEKLGDDADKVKSVGISIAGDGTISYFAQMKEASDKRSEEIQEGLKERREDAKAERKEKEKERLEEHLSKTGEDKVNSNMSSQSKEAGEVEEKKDLFLKASSIEELLELIGNK